MNVKSFEQISTFGKANFEALLQSGSAATTGAKALASAYLDLAGEIVQRGTAAVKALSTARTPFEVQNVVLGLTRTNLEAAMAEGRRVQALVTSVLTDSVLPLTARMQAAASLFKMA